MTRKRSAALRDGLTLKVLLIAIAVMLLIGLVVSALYRAGAGAVNSGPALKPAATQFQWVTKPDAFPKNTRASFVVELQRFNRAQEAWQPYGDQEALVGAVIPATVQIVAINGSPPGAQEPIPAIPLLTASGTAYKAEVGPDGRITFVLQGSEAADARLTVIFLEAGADPTELTATFSVTD